MSIFMVDIEADGPAPGLFSMVSFGVVRIDRELETRFKGLCAPISERHQQEALAACHLTREQTLAFPPAAETMARLGAWLKEHNEGKMVFLSDNPSFDFAFVNYYFHAFEGDNPFGFSARRLGDFCAGLVGRWDATSAYKAYIKTAHTHDPLDDALGNAEAFVALCDAHGVKVPGLARAAGPKAP